MKEWHEKVAGMLVVVVVVVVMLVAVVVVVVVVVEEEEEEEEEEEKVVAAVAAAGRPRWGQIRLAAEHLTVNGHDGEEYKIDDWSTALPR